MGGVPGGVVEVVQHRDQRTALLLVQPGAQVQDLDLVGDVEVRGRLVEQQQRRLLGQRHGDPDALALAAGQLVHRPVGEVGDPGGGHRLVDDPLVLARPLPQEALVGVAAPGDQFGDADPVRRDRRLRQQAEGAGDLAGGQVVDVPTVQQHRAGARAQHPRQRAQQGRLATRVRPDDHRERSVGHRHGQILGDGAPVVGEGQRGAAEAGRHEGSFERGVHSRPARRSTANSQTR